jgi:hypothetical protein
MYSYKDFNLIINPLIYQHITNNPLNIINMKAKQETRKGKSVNFC